MLQSKYRGLKAYVFGFFLVAMILGVSELFLFALNTDHLVTNDIYKQYNGIAFENLINSGIYLRDNQLFWKLSSKHLDVSTQGFRDNAIFVIPKPKDMFRIICIGDSVVFGSPMNIVKSEQAYPKDLERLLTSKISKKVQVINAGVPGYSSLQGARYLERDLLKFQPDLIIVHFGVDDGTPAIFFNDKEQPVAPAAIFNLQKVFGKSRIYQLLNKAIFYLKCKFTPKVATSGPRSYKRRVSDEDYVDNLEKIDAICKENNIRVLFITPIVFEYGNVKAIYKIPYNLRALDLYQVLSAVKKEELSGLFLDNCHLTIRGHQIMANSILSAMKDEGLMQ